MPKWCEGKVTNRKVWAPGLFTIRIEVPTVEAFSPGQFLQLGLYHETPDSDDPKLINRPYSVASPHGDELEFFIVLVEAGELTPKLWDLEVGDTIWVSQRATGSFTLEKTPSAKNLWLIATGTGLAPYVAMLRTDLPWERFKRIFVIHGVRLATDLAYTEELMEYEKQYPGRFKLLQTLTRDESPGRLSGRIPDLLDDGRLEKSAGVEIAKSTCSLLLCGNPAMLTSMEEILERRNMHAHRSKTPGNIVRERYW